MSRVSIKNGDIIGLVNKGILTVDYSDVDGGSGVQGLQVPA